MWGGRFAAGPDAIMEAINASIGFDKRMAAQDIAGSRAHAAMLAATGVITDNDAEAIREGLLTVLSEIEGGTFQFSTALEDIHMNVEARLKEIIGEPAGRLHTGRSRNDQVATEAKRKLNPLFVNWLMGWPIGWAGSMHFGPAEMELWFRRQRQRFYSYLQRLF